MGKTLTSKKSFTLIELLLVVSLSAILGLGLYHFLSQITSLWKGYKNYNAIIEEDFFCIHLRMDLENAVSAKVTPFRGKRYAISFTRQVDCKINKELCCPFQNIEYYFSPAEQRLIRVAKNFCTNEVKKTTMLFPVKELAFSFLILSSGSISEVEKIEGEYPNWLEVKIINQGEKVRKYLLPVNLAIKGVKN